MIMSSRDKDALEKPGNRFYGTQEALYMAKLSENA